MSGPRRSVNFLLGDTPLFGGTKIALHQANLLARLGHRVRVVTPGSRPDWYPVEAEFVQVPALEARHIPAADVQIATFWTTIAVALAAEGKALHYCQGFEASFVHNHDEHPAILEAYGLPLPAITVAPHLVELVESRFHRPARVVPQPIEAFFKPRFRWAPRRPPRILVMGPLEIEWKGVATAISAVARLKSEEFDCRLTRLSQWPLSDAERAILEPDEFLQHLRPTEVAELLRACDLLVAASWEQEGFGLPALEAMACGVPVVASDVSSYRGFAQDGAILLPPRDVDAFAESIRDVLESPRTWRSLRRAGSGVARRFGEAQAGEAMADAVEWVLSGPELAS